ncbi:MAG: PVC-type heme-binding CxxCH protein [Spirosomataceae bacterium]
MKTFSVILCCVGLFWMPSTQAQKKKNEPAAAPVVTSTPRRLEILFLGDNGHHRPIERVPMAMSALGPKGINFTYSDNLNSLNKKYLDLFDAVLLYANWDSIPPPQEKALIDYVASGKGLIAVHCASYCFRNSPELVKMMGGQFWRHTWDTIRPIWTRPDHPAIMGTQAFKTLDETYLHSKLQADNLVLTEREIQPDQYKDKPNQKTEPYTWVRTHGQGRVFYTAYGHDENTWGQPGFMALLEKGIHWAVGDKALNDFKALNPQSFTYREVKLPNYEKRSEPQVQQGALSPSESMKHIQVPPDFNLSLFAAEPNVQHPIAMSWDEKGRLYVLITKDYPNERKDTGGSDFILICEDTDHDGKADKFSKFADNLSIPTGMVFANGGLIVSQAPHMLFLKDTDGDDKADERKILFSGFGTGDTHAGPSNLHYGFDNWIWGCVGYSGFVGKPKDNTDSLKFGQAFFRFKPDGSKIEWMTSTSNNTWGMSFNEAGDVFGSTANNSHGWYMAIPHRNFNGVVGMGSDNGSRSTDTHKDMKTITPRIRQVDVFGGFTAAAGHNFYTARAFPKQYWNKIAFVAEPTGHVLHQNQMVKKGSDYEDKEAFNLLAGADEWFSPVFAEVGPDGAVWVADWYSFIIQHNPRPDGFKMGVGNAYETDLRDYTHGRIYRVAWKDAPAYTPISLSKERPDELVNALKNNNLFWRMHAQRLLVERGQTDVVPALLELLQDQSVDAVGLNVGAIHALWTLKGLGVIDSPLPVGKAARAEVITSLKHLSPAVRKNAVQVLPRTEASVKVLLDNNCLNDDEPLVVLNTILALSEMPLSSEVEKIVLNRLETATEANDRWLPDAFACILTSKQAKLLKQYVGQLSQKGKEAPMHHDHAAMMQTANKQAAASTTAPTQESSLVDLTITDIQFEPNAPFVRDRIRYFVSVKNAGKDSLKKGIPVPLNIRIEGQGQRVTVYSLAYKNGIGPGETVTISRLSNGPWEGDMGFSTDVAGEYTFSVVADLDNKIAEGNEKNNTFSKKLSFQSPQRLAVFALERAARSYASVAPADSVAALLKNYEKLNADESRALLRGLTDGWNPRRKEKVTESNQQFMVSLANKLPKENSERLGKLMQAWDIKNAVSEADKNAMVIKIKSVKEAMKFDLKEFTVPAGKSVIIEFENPDAMQHNLVIGKPSSLAVIGKAADKMITAKDAAEKNYVPAIPQVLFSTPLVNPDQTYQLKFTAPTTPGDYPFVCTFPGHWSLMNGVMKVK